MIIESLVLLLLQGASGDTANVRIVGEPTAPAVLVGKPCEPDPNNRIVPRLIDESAGGAIEVLFGPFQSVSYECELGCQLGLEVRDRRAPISFRIGVITLLEQGSWMQMAFSPIPIAPSQSCGNTPITIFPLASRHNNWRPIDGFLLYVREIIFADGSKWQLSEPEEFGKRITRKWQEKARRPNRGQRR